MARDQWGVVIGKYTRNVPVTLATVGSFIGLASTTDNIKSVSLFATVGSQDWPGLAFSDLQYRRSTPGIWKFWIPPAIG